MKCHRCQEPMTMYVVGDDYCATCRREIKARESRVVIDLPLWRKRLTAKDMTDWRPVA